MEDHLASHCRSIEKIRVKRELYLMGEEEGVRGVYALRDLDIEESKLSKAAMDEVRSFYGFTVVLLFLLLITSLFTDKVFIPYLLIDAYVTQGDSSWVWATNVETI